LSADTANKSQEETPAVENAADESPKGRAGTGLTGVLRRLGLILFGLLFAWLLIEVLMRVGFDYLPPSIQADVQSVQLVPWPTGTTYGPGIESSGEIIPHIPWVIDDVFQLRLPPGMVNFPVHWSDAKFTFNTIAPWDGYRAGFRSDPPSWPLDVVTFGDSFTFCWTKLEDCWVHHLQADYDWHVFDAGSPGIGTTAEYNLMKEIAPPYKPRLIIWQWCENDVSDDYDLAHIRHETPDLQGAPQPDTPPVLQGLARYSVVDALLSKWFNPPPRKSPYQHTQWATLNGRFMLVHTNEYPFGSSLAWPENQYGQKRNIQAHEAGEQLAASLNARMIIVALPTKEVTYSDYLKDKLGQSYLEQIDQTRQMLLDECKQNGWDCIDPLPSFQDAVRNGQTVYYAFDSHLDASGNRILAQLVHDYVMQNQMLPGRS